MQDYILCGDSAISLCWVSSEKKSLSIFHRNRVLQIRRSSELDHLYHVRTDENLADLGTRPDRVKLTDVGPDSELEQGKPWMKSDTSEAVSNGILKPLSELRLTVEKDAEDYRSGFLYGDDDPSMVSHVINSNQVEKIQSRAQVSNYLVLPSKFGFTKTVRITAIVLAFISKCRRKSIQSVELSEENSSFKFSVFHLNSDSAALDLLEVFRHSVLPCNDKFRSTQTISNSSGNYLPSDKFLHQALVYLYRIAAKEVFHFNPKEKIEKIAVSKDRILFDNLRLRSHLPVIDRHSPLAYAIGNYVHWSLAQHRGPETCSRISLENVHIIFLFREIGENCIKCRIKRKKFL